MSPRGQPAARLLLCLFFVLLLSQPRRSGAADYGLSLRPGGGPVCRNGSWTEVDVELIMSYKQSAHIQCWRKPAPCIRYSYLNPTICRALVKDEDWPTADPHLTVPEGMVTMRDVVQDYLRNKTLMLVGDSINGLVYHAATCELHRWGLTVGDGQASVAAGDLPGTTLGPRLRAYWRAVARLNRLHDAVAGGETGPGFWLPDVPGQPKFVQETETLVVKKGWHRWQRSDMTGILSLADVVVVNYGLHYGQEGSMSALEVYERDMALMFAQLEAFARRPGKAALVREIGAQHFPGTGAYAGREQSHLTQGSTCVCGPMEHSTSRDNRVTIFNAVLHRLARSHPHVRVLPFYDLTAPRHDMHEAEFCALEQRRSRPNRTDVCCDCTHFCHTPQLWRHFFAGLHTELPNTRVLDA